ncbi:MAG: GPR endopeptidase [Bacilli bacterium]|nr:GPR endopeptidase [Bacilli bacterium]
MKEVDLSKYEIRTDLVVDLIEKSPSFETKTVIDDITISNIKLDERNSKELNKEKGDYTTIYFKDITDTSNYEKVLEVTTNELSKMLKNSKIKDEYFCLIIGLGNEKSTADELGVTTAKKVIVTKHIYDLTGTLEEGYRVTACLIPGVMGTTGIETSDVISSVIEKVKPDFIIAIDALASDSIDRLLKTIQITNTGINPGSGVGNNRKEISEKVFNIPVIAIGVPTVVEASTIVNDTLNYMKKSFSYNIKNKNKSSDKLIPTSNINYLKNNPYTLSKEESKVFLGILGDLTDYEKKVFIKDILNPIGYDLIVTPKEIDFIVQKLTDLISSAINNCIHNISTKKV